MKHRKHTPITSQSEQGAMGAAYSAKKGETPVSELGSVAKQMYESMTRGDLRSHLIESGGKKLPKRVKKKK